MKKLSVNTSHPYEVLVGEDLLKDAGVYISEVHKACTAVVITDDVVDRLYAGILGRSLERAGFFVRKFIFRSGEHSKNISTYTEILKFLADNRITRGDMLVALGGGVVGDLTGFVAATYLRGISFVQIPTTLLSAIDSSVGGKTGLDLDAGKNLVGVFCQPDLVICETSILRELPSGIFSDGAAEVIKYGVISDEEIFTLAESGSLHDNLPGVVYDCLKIKRSIVEQDEFDVGARAILNFGHTIGHAIEAGTDYAVSHGRAVAAGMYMMAKAARMNGFCSEDVEQRIAFALRVYGLSTDYGVDARELKNYMLSDKKRSGELITIVLPESIGRCVLKDFSIEDFLAFLKKGGI